MRRMIDRWIKVVLLLVFFVFGVVGQARAEEPEKTLLFDSSNHYTGACRLTDKTTWTQETDLAVGLFQIWYNWDSAEKEVGFVLKKDGQEFLSGNVQRTTCDTYQKNWCNGDLAVEKTFEVGQYELTVAKSKQCAIPSGNGTVRLYGNKKAPTFMPTIMATPTLLPSLPPAKSEVVREYIPKCPPFNYYLLGGSVLLNFVLLGILLGKRK